ncbi:MAG TPA: hypothetical protein VF511_00030, partial [Chthoniobacterales bacterium]
MTVDAALCRRAVGKDAATQLRGYSERSREISQIEAGWRFKVSIFQHFAVSVFPRYTAGLNEKISVADSGGGDRGRSHLVGI